MGRSGALAMLIGIAGCVGAAPHDLLTKEQMKDLPRFHSIGTSGILTYDPDKEIVIPIEGANLDKCVLDVFVEGTIPLRKSDDYELVTDTTHATWRYGVLVKKAYLARCNNEDRLRVKAVALARLAAQPKLPAGGKGNASPSPSCRPGTVLASASREFVLATFTRYRERYLTRQVPFQDLNITYIPEKEARMLFGPKVSRHYFVVALAIRNTEPGTDKLVNIGMIRARGAALVEPLPGVDKLGAFSRYTVHVEGAPQSLQKVYKILVDEAHKESRQVVFRALTFVGALASAATAFSVPRDYDKGTSLFAGVFLPELAKLWPDREVGYQANVVRFGMPDLMKIPANTVSEPRVLFFSKSEIHGLIRDQSLFGGHIKEPVGSWLKGEGYERPHAHLISVEFDSLDIPFENVFSVESTTVRDRVLDAKSDLGFVLAECERLKQPIALAARDLGATKEVQPLKAGLEQFETVVLNDGEAGTEVLERDAETLDEITQALTRGRSPERYKETVAGIEERVARARRALDAYRAALEAARALREHPNREVPEELIRQQIAAVADKVPEGRPDLFPGLAPGAEKDPPKDSKK